MDPPNPQLVSKPRASRQAPACLVQAFHKTLVLEPADNEPLQQNHYLPTLGSFSLSLKRRMGLLSQLTASAIRKNALRLEEGARDHVSAADQVGLMPSASMLQHRVPYCWRRVLWDCLGR